ncbi:MAG: FAD-dependent oxidoreductase, partial [Candidatus Wallbacteria bacterium]|nr:FAD-dependent oxidoreductase [Candidatus Wallbacteria bacterium]
MKKYDFLVIGSGSGADFALTAAGMGHKVALVDQGPPGGTCLNRGCIPTKIMIRSSEVAELVRNSWSFGVRSRLEHIDLLKIWLRVQSITGHWRDQLSETLSNHKNLDFYNSRGIFKSDRVLDVGDTMIEADRVVLAVGMEPILPSIPGLSGLPFFTSDNLMEMKELPESLAILGGGYIGMEFANFFAALGTRVSVIEAGEFLLS